MVEKLIRIKIYLYIIYVGKNIFMKCVHSSWNCVLTHVPLCTSIMHVTCTSHYARHIMHVTLCTSHYARHIMHVTLGTSHYARHMHNTLCTTHYARHIMHITLCTSHYAHHIMHVTLCTSHYARHIMHITLCWSDQLIDLMMKSTQMWKKCYIIKFY